MIDTVNKYATFFRKQALNWCGTDTQVAMIILAQANTKGSEYARGHNGTYLIDHFAEGNELQRASAVVITIYHNIYVAQLGLIKFRDGESNGEIFEIETNDLNYYTFGDTVTVDDVNEYRIPRIEDVLGEYYEDKDEKNFDIPKELDYGV